MEPPMHTDAHRCTPMHTDAHRCTPMHRAARRSVGNKLKLAAWLAENVQLAGANTCRVQVVDRLRGMNAVQHIYRRLFHRDRAHDQRIAGDNPLVW